MDIMLFRAQVSHMLSKIPPQLVPAAKLKLDNTLMLLGTETLSIEMVAVIIASVL